jgi:hypothetical protein
MSGASSAQIEHANTRDRHRVTMRPTMARSQDPEVGGRVRVGDRIRIVNNRASCLRGGRQFAASFSGTLVALRALCSPQTAPTVSCASRA